jgi:hypothetical protein
MQSIARLRRRQRAKRGIAEIVAAIFVILIIFVAFGVFTVMFNSFANYTKQANQVNSQQAQNMKTSLSLSSFQFGSNDAPVSSYGTSCGTGATLNSDGSKLVYAAGMWFSFFICSISGSNDFSFTSSFDGITWGLITTPSSTLDGLGTGSTISLILNGTTVYMAVSDVFSTQFFYVTGTLAQGGTVAAPLGTFTLTSGAPFGVSTGNGNSNKGAGPISIEVDGAGNQWVALTTSTKIQVFEHPASSAPNTGWSSSSIAPSSLGSLNTGAVPIILAPPAGISTVGAIIVYESGSGTSGQTSQISVISTTSTSGATWNTLISLGGSGLSDYSLTSSSAVMDGYVLCFAGLASTSSGVTTGTLNFWTLAFSTTIAAGEVSAETKIESATAAWQAALTVSGFTLTLFDNPSGGTSIQSYTSSTNGNTWSVSTTEATGETAINGLSPAFGSPAITWTNSGGLIRFLALSSLTVTNNSGFPVELVSLFVSNPSTNSLVAIYFKNSTRLYDYWTGAGSFAVTPAYFGYTASTSYLVTAVTSTGVIVSSTFTSLA